MRTIQLVAVLAVAATVLVMVGSTSAQAERWFVVQHNLGQTSVADRNPGRDWFIVSGPYITRDAAIRASGVGSAAVENFAGKWPTDLGQADPVWDVPAAAGSMSDFRDFR